LPKVLPVGVQRSPSFRTSALQVTSASAANLKYRDVEANGSANINCRQGTVRFWFKPAWNSGQGPGAAARLLEMGNSETSEGWWALSLDGTGRNISLTTRATGCQPVVVLTRTLTTDWIADQWHEITLTYSASASALYVDGAQLGTAGSGVSGYPNATTRAAYGFSIGSNQAGGEQAKGQFEELETFNYALSAGDISANYVAVTNSAAPFAIGVYGDLQMLAGVEYGGGQAQYNLAVDTLGNWIESDNLRVALCSGDLVHLCDTDQPHRDLQWNVASNAWKGLQGRCLVVIAPGNHEQFDPTDPDPSHYAKFNSTFGWIGPTGNQGDRYAAGMQTAYWRETISGLPFLFLTIEYQDSDSQIANQVAWAKNRIQTQFPNDLVVLITHCYLNPQGVSGQPWIVARDPRGDYLWTNLVNPLPNVMMVLSGHYGFPGNARVLPRSSNASGRIVNELYLNYQGCGTEGTPICCGSNPWYADGRTSAVARLIKVDPLNNLVTVKHWSCEPQPGFWLTNFDVPPPPEPKVTTSEGSYAFPLFD
jgi:hypothetical protein